MHIIIDTVLILVFLITVIYYYKIGFVKALFSVCKFFISVAIAFSLASSVGEVISEKVIYKSIESTVNEKTQSIAKSLNENSFVSDLIESLPSSIKMLIFSSNSATDELNGELAGEIISEESIIAVSGIISERISVIVSNIIAFLILFALSMIALTVLSFLLDKLCTLPVLKQTNKFLGLVFGTLFGSFHVFAACTIITLILHLLGVDLHEMSVEAIKEKTVVYSFVESIDLSHLIIEFFRAE